MHDDIYELHVAEGGRWHLQERFRGTQKDEAVEEAKRHFASPSVEAVRVILEKYDEAEQLFKQRTIYRQSKQKVAPPLNPPTPAAAPRRIAAPPRAAAPISRTAQARPLGSAASVLAAPAAPGSIPPKPAPMPRATEAEAQGRSLASRLMLSGLIAVVLSGLGVLLLTGVLGGEGGLLAMVDPLIIYLLAVLVFTAAFGISLQMFSRTGRRRPRLAEDSGANVDATESSDATDPAAPHKTNGSPSDATDAPLSAADLARRDAEQKAIEERGLAAILGTAPVPEEAAAAPDAPPPTAADAPPTPDPTPQAAPATESAATAGHRDFLLAFLRDALTHPATQPFIAQGFDGRNRFACHLFILGAAEAILAKTKTGPQELPLVIGGALEALGTGPDRAGTFLARAADYRRDEKFNAAINAGRAAMASRLKTGSGGAETLGAALEAWNGSNEAAQKTLDIAILFTDMVASVATTQRLGEEQAMRLVQTHNAIVAVALKRHRGHQVKHTGDGIMAVFQRVADGLTAAVDIQRQCSEHNHVTPGEQILLRIGLSAGQPVQENNDYFGTIVQLSARLSSLGEPGDIHCDATFASYVKENSVAPLSAPFDVPLKGFAQQQTVYRVDWQGEAPATGTAE